MELNINSPLYYKDKYGIDDVIAAYCQDLHMYFKDKNYSDVLTTIGVIPILAPVDAYDKGEWKEHVSFIAGNSVATVEIQMDLDLYLKATDEERILMYKDMILRAAKKVKSKGKFDVDSFQRDLLSK